MYITTKQTAARLGKSERTIYAWLKSGKIQGKKVNGKWQIFPASLEKLQPEVAPQQIEVEKTEVYSFVEDMMKRVFEQVEIISQAVKEVESASITKENEAKEQKLREFEVLSRVVNNQLKLKEQNEDLRRQNLMLQASVRKINTKLLQIKEKSKNLYSTRSSNVANSSVEQNQKLRSNNMAAASDSNKPASASKPIQSQDKAEKWVRNNIGEWFQKPCSFGQLANYSFEDIALNNAPKAMINGKMQPSRAYLHVLAKKSDSWRKYKAIVALEITESKKESYSRTHNHYEHSYEVGG